MTDLTSLVAQRAQLSKRAFSSQLPALIVFTAIAIAARVISMVSDG